MPPTERRLDRRACWTARALLVAVQGYLKVDGSADESQLARRGLKFVQMGSSNRGLDGHH